MYSICERHLLSFVNVAMFVWSLSLYNIIEVKVSFFYAKSRTCSFIVYYLPIEGDEVIEKVEKELNRVIKAPCNSQYPDEYVSIMPEQKAF